MKLSKNRKINTSNNDYSKTVDKISCHMHFNIFTQHQMWINKHSEILGSWYWRSNIATNINWKEEHIGDFRLSCQGCISVFYFPTTEAVSYTHLTLPTKLEV